MQQRLKQNFIKNVASWRTLVYFETGARPAIRNKYYKLGKVAPIPIATRLLQRFQQAEVQFGVISQEHVLVGVISQEHVLPEAAIHINVGYQPRAYLSC